ncbi:hypothetical protein [Acidithiobacillus thiooxidans]|uniref:hypothetical protein n=1 Tax=Acidithiobacillus thiooxidans TaxID=930 RepID=UPI0015945CAE|nr:hypothetical protein [Acidithiobacillus thiooxidans]
MKQTQKTENLFIEKPEAYSVLKNFQSKWRLSVLQKRHHYSMESHFQNSHSVLRLFQQASDPLIDAFSGQLRGSGMKPIYPALSRKSTCTASYGKMNPFSRRSMSPALSKAWTSRVDGFYIAFHAPGDLA